MINFHYIVWACVHYVNPEALIITFYYLSYKREFFLKTYYYQAPIHLLGLSPLGRDDEGMFASRLDLLFTKSAGITQNPCGL